MGHPSENVLELLPFISNFNGQLDKGCEVCQVKQSRNNFPSSQNKSTKIFELIHCDLWGPYNESSSCGAPYFITFVDDYSRPVWVYLSIDKR